jgi:hypothetical protein
VSSLRALLLLLLLLAAWLWVLCVLVFEMGGSAISPLPIIGGYLRGGFVGFSCWIENLDWEPHLMLLPMSILGLNLNYCVVNVQRRARTHCTTSFSIIKKRRKQENLIVCLSSLVTG